MKKLKDKVAVITGGGTGIGAATARELASLGAKVVVSGRRPDKLEAVVKAITASGGTAMAMSADMADEQQIKALVDGAVAAFGQIDILHCNAALTDAASHAADGAIADMDAALWDKVMAVNLRGYLAGTTGTSILTLYKKGQRQMYRPFWSLHIG